MIGLLTSKVAKELNLKILTMTEKSSISPKRMKFIHQFK